MEVAEVAVDLVQVPLLRRGRGDELEQQQTGSREAEKTDRGETPNGEGKKNSMVMEEEEKTKKRE